MIKGVKRGLSKEPPEGGKLPEGKERGSFVKKGASSDMIILCTVM